MQYGEGLSTPDWSQAECAKAVEAGTADPDDWFTEDAKTRDFAHSICRGCPIKKDCLAYAKEEQLVGYWGGRLLGYKLETPERVTLPPLPIQTHCKYGHLKTQKKPNGQLRCAECNRNNSMKYYYKGREDEYPAAREAS